MKIYICKDFKCHASDDGTMSAVETDFFDGKCAEYINGYCYIPEGQSWIAPDGTVYPGEMIFPWKDWQDLDDAQRAYEQQCVSELEAENETLLNDMAQLVEEVYASDMEMMGL